MSLSGERNVFVDARAVASSSISAADKENNEEGGGDAAGMFLHRESSLKCGGRAQVPWLSHEELGALQYKKYWLHAVGCRDSQNNKQNRTNFVWIRLVLNYLSYIVSLLIVKARP